ncbi:MAG: hypothetical protein ACTJF0_08205 [Psychroflexus halocasei]
MKAKSKHGLKVFRTSKRQAKDTKNRQIKQLKAVLFKQPMSRRMAAAAIGYGDKTYMVTQPIFELLKNGQAEVVGRIKCKRSNKIVEAITTNPEIIDKFKNS